MIFAFQECLRKRLTQTSGLKCTSWFTTKTFFEQPISSYHPLRPFTTDPNSSMKSLFRRQSLQEYLPLNCRDLSWLFVCRPAECRSIESSEHPSMDEEEEEEKRWMKEKSAEKDDRWRCSRHVNGMEITISDEWALCFRRIVMNNWNKIFLDLFLRLWYLLNIMNLNSIYKLQNTKLLTIIFLNIIFKKALENGSNFFK